MAKNELLFHYTQTRSERARKFLAMALMCGAYMVGMLLWEHFSGERLPDDFRSAGLWGFGVAAVMLLVVTIWHWRHPAEFEVRLTAERLTVHYPGSAHWSFDVAVADIKRFEHRQTLSHAGRGIGQHGILLYDGSFHHISMNYGLSINHLHRQIQRLRPEVSFPKSVNLKVEGPLSRDYRD